MKLYYHQFDGGVENFGDTLNAWLWPQLLPDVLDDDARVAFVGIGTLLNDSLPHDTPEAERRIVFSSGAGYGDAWHIRPQDAVYCVRGPLTARALSLPPEAAVTDGAALIRRLVPGSRAKVCKAAFMPHIEHIADRAWQSVCADLGVGYIDPRWSTERVLAAIGRTETLFTEAMHGAIVADALRVPWVAVTTRGSILPFKWQDWCASLEMEYRPVRLPTLFNPRLTRDLMSPARDARFHHARKAAYGELRRVVRTARPMLSADVDLECAVERLEERVERFKRDVVMGRFA